jgi:hypothetical protein
LASELWPTLSEGIQSHAVDHVLRNAAILLFDQETAQVWGRLRVPNPESPLDKQIAATALIFGDWTSTADHIATIVDSSSISLALILLLYALTFDEVVQLRCKQQSTEDESR